jgi:hypothetical protein
VAYSRVSSADIVQVIELRIGYSECAVHKGHMTFPRKFVFENYKCKEVLRGLCLGEEGAVDSSGTLKDQIRFLYLHPCYYHAHLL